MSSTEPGTEQAGTNADGPRYRVFLSYSHEDAGLAEEVAAILRPRGLEPLYDRHIRPGTAFTEAIKGMIAHAHVFVPLITKNSRTRPWVHQETGYAMALHLPVLPIAVEEAPGEMIAELQAITVGRDLADLPARLDELSIEHLILPLAVGPISMVEVTDWVEQRSEALARNAKRVLALGHCGRVKQRAALSSFSIPDKDPDDPVWEVRDGGRQRGDYSHYLLWQERRALDQHARAAGCDLLIDPSVETSGRTAEARVLRLQTLWEFLDSMPDEKVRVVCSERARDANITFVGDWFLAESRLHQPGKGWHQTVFNWHSPTVLQQVRQFDALFDSLLQEWCPQPASSREKAMSEIRRTIEELGAPSL